MNATRPHVTAERALSTDALLDELRLERDAWQPANHDYDRLRKSARWWLAGGIAALLATMSGMLVWPLLTRSRPVPAEAPATPAVSAVTPGKTAAAPPDGVMFEASGFVVASRKATISAKTSGKLQQLYIEVGQHIGAGAIIAKLDDSNSMASLQQSQAGVVQATAALAAAQAAAEDIGPIYESNRKQAAAGLISAQTLQASKSTYDAQQAAVAVAQGNLAMARGALAIAQRAEDDTTIRAPFTGVIVDKAAQVGEIVSAAAAPTHAGIATLVDMTSLEVEVNVDESFIGRIHPQQPASVQLKAYPDLEIPAFVSAVVPTADRNKGTVAVRVGFKAVDPRTLPDMAAHVSFLPAQPDAVSLTTKD